MDRIITETVNLCPVLKDLKYKFKNQKKIDRVKNALEVIDWNNLCSDIVDNTIFTWDTFLEIYFIKNDPVPRLRKLDTSKVTDIATDEYGRVKAYIYKDTVINDEVKMTSSPYIDRTSEREVTWVFERGKTTIIDPYNTVKDTEGVVLLDSDGEPVVEPIQINHKSMFKDEFYIIHIPSIMKQDNVFSEPISSRYVDPCLKLDAIVSDIRFINRMLAMGLNIIIDGQVVAGSSRSPGGFIGIKSNTEKQAQYIRAEVNNKLDTLITEFSDAEIDLYRKAFLIRPDLEKQISGSDSSRVTAQLRLPLEKFLSKLLNNVNKGMKKYFEMLQKSYGEKTIDSIEFEIPNPVIENSIFDQLLQDIQELSYGKKTMRDIWKKMGLTEEEMTEKEKQINEEIMNGNNDIKINKQVANVVGNANNTPVGVDKNFL